MGEDGAVLPEDSVLTQKVGRALLQALANSHFQLKHVHVTAFAGTARRLSVQIPSVVDRDISFEIAIPDFINELQVWQVKRRLQNMAVENMQVLLEDAGLPHLI